MKRRRRWDEKYTRMKEKYEEERKDERDVTQTGEEKKTKEWKVKHPQH